MIQNQNPTTQAYAELQHAFEHYNSALFEGRLPACLITMQRQSRVYGYYSSRQFIHRHDKSTIDEIAMNPAYFGIVPLLEILQTLVHEMVHAWQQHFGKPGRRTYHNREWAAKMEEIGLMPSHNGLPGGDRVGECIMDYPLEGGLFMAATRDLLDAGFEVTWLDRYPPAEPAVYELPPAPTPASGMAADTSAPDDVIVLEPLAAPPPSELGTVAGKPDLFALKPYTLRPSDVAGLEALATHLCMPDPKANRSNRIKYRCPSCQAQVWGKPGLKLLCGEELCEQSPFDVVA